MAEGQEVVPSIWQLIGDPEVQPRCPALGELSNYLALHSLGPPNANEGGPQRMVVSCLGVEHAAVTWSSMAVVNNGPVPRFVVSASVLYPGAPELQKIVLKRDYSLFKMIPGTNYSQWLESRHLGAKFYRSWLGSTANSDEAWQDDVDSYGYGEFSLRLYVLPMEDFRLAELLIVAMPVSKEGFARLPDNHVAADSGGYPAVLFDAGTTTPATVGPRPAEGGDPFGMPCYPVLILPAGAETPAPGVIINAGRKLWSNAVQPYLVEAEEWTNLTAGTPVATEDREVEFPWPRIAPVVVEPVDGGGEFVTVILVVVCLLLTCDLVCRWGSFAYGGTCTQAWH